MFNVDVDVHMYTCLMFMYTGVQPIIRLTMADNTRDDIESS